jgi:hypothetical protein
MRHLTMMPMLLMAAAGDPSGGGPSPDPAPSDASDPAPGGPKPVPYERFQEVNGERTQFKAERDQLQAQVAELEARAAQAEKVQQAFDAYKQQAADDLVLAELGVDGSGRKVARTLFQDVPEAERPEGGLQAWVRSMREDPTAAPRPMRPYFDASPAPAPAPPQGSPSPPPDPASGASGSPPSTTQGEVSAEAIRAAREKGARTGDWTTFRKLTGQQPEPQA